MNTIIEVDQINYSENIIVTKENLLEVSNFIKSLKWSYIVKGEVLIKNTYRILDIVRKRNINSLCPWENVVTTYKACTLARRIDGYITFIEMPLRETYITNMKIKDLTWGLKKIK
jgi:hypothetical protein